MNFVREFINGYGMEILYAILTAIAGYVGIAIKRLYQKCVNDNAKKSIVSTCVQAVEQLYRNLHGEDKFNKAIEYATNLLNEKGIETSYTELKLLIESAVGEFNRVFEVTEE